MSVYVKDIRQRHSINRSIASSNFYTKIGQEIEVDLAPGKTVFIKALAVTDTNENGEQEVFFHYNGTLRSG